MPNNFAKRYITINPPSYTFHPQPNGKLHVCPSFITDCPIQTSPFWAAVFQPFPVVLSGDTFEVPQPPGESIPVVLCLQSFWGDVTVDCSAADLFLQRCHRCLPAGWRVATRQLTATVFAKWGDWASNIWKILGYLVICWLGDGLLWCLIFPMEHPLWLGNVENLWHIPGNRAWHSLKKCQRQGWTRTWLHITVL